MIAPKLQKLIDVYNMAGVSNGSELLPPADPDIIGDLSRGAGKPIPAELNQRWGIYGGQGSIDNGTKGIFGSHHLLTPELAIDSYRMVRGDWFDVIEHSPKYPPPKGERGCWVPGLIPFATWDHFILFADPDSGNVWEFDPYNALFGWYQSIWRNA